MRADSILYLKNAGFDFKPAESPDLWSHLEDHFAVAPRRVGPKFVPMSGTMIADLIGRGEDALLDAMVAQHRRTGKLDHVEETIEMPFIVGTDGAVTIKTGDDVRVLELIDRPGTAQERRVHVLPAKPDDIPGTHKVTVKGGIYPDGHTAGYYDLSPGHHAREAAAPMRVWLATPAEIAALAHDMEQKSDDIALATREECAAMLARVRDLLH